MNLKNLETRLDDALNNEITESLTEWLDNKRNNMTEQEMNRLSEKLDEIEARIDNMNRTLDKIIEEIDKSSKTITNEYDIWAELKSYFHTNKKV